MSMNGFCCDCGVSGGGRVSDVVDFVVVVRACGDLCDVGMEVPRGSMASISTTSVSGSYCDIALGGGGHR